GAARRLDDPARVLQALHEIAVAVGGVLEAEALARLVAKRARDLLGADLASLHYWDAEASALLPLYLTGPTALPSRPIGSGAGAARDGADERDPRADGGRGAGRRPRWSCHPGQPGCGRAVRRGRRPADRDRIGRAAVGGVRRGRAPDRARGAAAGAGAARRAQ